MNAIKFMNAMTALMNLDANPQAKAQFLSCDRAEGAADGLLFRCTYIGIKGISYTTILTEYL